MTVSANSPTAGLTRARKSYLANQCITPRVAPRPLSPTRAVPTFADGVLVGSLLTAVIAAVGMVVL